MTAIKDTPRYEVGVQPMGRYLFLDITGYNLTYYGTVAILCPLNKHEATRLRDVIDEWLKKQSEKRNVKTNDGQ